MLHLAELRLHADSDSDSSHPWESRTRDIRELLAKWRGMYLDIVRYVLQHLDAWDDPLDKEILTCKLVRAGLSGGLACADKLACLRALKPVLFWHASPYSCLQRWQATPPSSHQVLIPQSGKLSEKSISILTPAYHGRHKPDYRLIAAPCRPAWS